MSSTFFKHRPGPKPKAAPKPPKPPKERKPLAMVKPRNPLRKPKKQITKT